MDCDEKKKNDRASFANGGKSVFGKYSDPDMLSRIKGLALDPCASGASKSSIRPLWNQTLKVQKYMELSSADCPRRKRKLQQFLKENFAAARRLTSEISDQPSVTNMNKRQLSNASSISCLPNSVDSTKSFNKKILNSHTLGSSLTSEDNFPSKQIPRESSYLDNAVDWGLPRKKICISVESDESDSGTVLHDPPPLDLDDDSVHSSNYSSSEDPKGTFLQAPRRSIRLLNFVGDHLQRMVIPIGPLFQAEVPEWTGPPNKQDFNDTENSRWLGTRIWPLEDSKSKETNAKSVGKGRPNSCSCVLPGSIDCIKRHVVEKRLVLRSDLGPAFLSWKFDEMGEEVSKLWTLKEEEKFESLAKTYPISHGKDFLKHALRCFPSKGKERILSYYFNVFIPRRTSLQTRSP